jgi:hypothetical protein
MFNRGSNINPSLHQQERQFVNNLTGQLDRSADNGWAPMNQPGAGRAHLIAEESSGQEYTSGGQGAGARRKKKVKTNKNFLEPSQQQMM